MLKEVFVDYINTGIRKNWDLKAFEDYQGESFTYAEVAASIVKIHQLYKQAGIQKGDKIALVGRNSSRWCIVYLATVTYGAVIVPILPDFKTEDIQDIINHSDSNLLFCADQIFENFDSSKHKSLKGIISVNTYEQIHSYDKKFEEVVQKIELAKAEPVKKDDFNPPIIGNENLAVISYTSGTTGHSKGVMISHNSLAANIRYAQANMPLNPGDPIVVMLPLAHAFGCAFDFLFPFSIGSTINILTKSPAIQLILQAFQEKKPALIMSVPLVVEKIYKKQLMPVINKPAMKILLAIPGINKIILGKIRKKLEGVFGGNFRELVIGGAAFNPEAEAFFKKMKFKFAVGYGMTECGPLISYAPWDITPAGSSGRPVDTLEVKIDSEDPQNVVGEIILKGDNVMDGYYKNKEATDQIIDKEGWLHTGDLGIIDEGGFIHIKGRSKSLILDASGQNIYPEEIESLLNNLYLINETLVVQRNNKLIALIHPDLEMKEKDQVSDDKLNEIYQEHISEVNSSLAKYMQIAGFEIMKEDFVKTPKRNIKRFIYQ